MIGGNGSVIVAGLARLVRRLEGTARIRLVLDLPNESRGVSKKVESTTDPFHIEGQACAAAATIRGSDVG